MAFFKNVDSEGLNSSVHAFVAHTLLSVSHSEGLTETTEGQRPDSQQHCVFGTRQVVCGDSDPNSCRKRQFMGETASHVTFIPLTGLAILSQHCQQLIG